MMRAASQASVVVVMGDAHACAMLVAVMSVWSRAMIMPVPGACTWACAGANRAQLVVQQPRTDERHQAPAQRLQPGFHRLDLQPGGAQQQDQYGDQHQRRHRLDQRRHERQQNAAPHGLAIGQHVGGDHRLAVAGARPRAARRRRS